MEPISLIAAVSSIITTLLASDKLKEHINLYRKRDHFERSLKIYKEFMELSNKVKGNQGGKIKEEIVKRIYIDDEAIKDGVKLFSAYKKINSNMPDIEVTAKKISEYNLYISFLDKNLKMGKSSRFGVAVNSGLISSLLKSFVSSTDRSAINRSTVVGMLVGKKMKEDTKSYIYLLSAFAVHIFTVIFGIAEFNSGVLALLFTMMSGLMINQKVLEFRIKKGLYGTNSYEVREILKYIEEHSDPDDFNDGGGRKKIFQDAVEDAPKEVIVYGGAYQ